MVKKAVIFDLGGVVLESPLHAIARFESDRGIPEGFLNRVVRETGNEGPWARLERGELDRASFFTLFDEACSARGHLLPTADVMEAIAESSSPRPVMVEALRQLRRHGLITAALTNNWAHDGRDRHQLRPLFDHFIESSVVGIRKPDPAIYELTFEQIGVEPQDTVFLDDIGGNLKPARAMGVATIKVDEAEQAIEDLEGVLGLALR